MEEFAYFKINGRDVYVFAFCVAIHSKERFITLHVLSS